MLGLTTGTELRLAFYGVLLAAIGGWLIYERAHLINEGEARIKAQDTSARAAQKAEDDKTHVQIVTELQVDNQNLRALAAKPAPLLRLCVPTRYVSTGTPSPRTQPPVAPAAREGGSGVPSGDSGLDIGGPVSDVAWAQAVVSQYRDRTWEWAVEQAKAVH